MEKELWAIFHCYDADGGFGDAVPQEQLVGHVWATGDELKTFLEQWDKPEVYDIPFAHLECHHVYAELVTPLDDISLFHPYDTDPTDYFNRGIKRIAERDKKEEN